MEPRTGLAIMAALGVAYGLGVAFAPTRVQEGPHWSRLIQGGAVLLLVLLVLLVGVPYLVGD